MPTTSQPRRVQKITQTTFAFPSMTLYSMLAGIRPIKSIHICWLHKSLCEAVKNQMGSKQDVLGSRDRFLHCRKQQQLFYPKQFLFFQQKITTKHLYIFISFSVFINLLFRSHFISIFVFLREQIQCFRDIFFNHTAYTARIDILFQQFNNLTATCMRTYCTI